MQLHTGRIVIKSFSAFLITVSFATATFAQDQIQNQTQDGVQGWIQQNSGVPHYLHALSFPSRDTAWVTTSGPFILRTTNAGQSWEQHSVPVTSAVTSISAIDGMTAWAGGVVGDGHVYFTKNGGQTWTQEITNLNKYPVEGIIFPTRNTGYGVCGTSILIKTTNGGQDWIIYGLDSGYLRAVSFIDSMNGMIAADAILYRIINGGPGRKVQTDPSFSRVTFLGCQLVTQNIEFAVGEERITPFGPYPGIVVRTTNGGKTWDKKMPSGLNDTSGFEGVAFTDSLHGTVVGIHGLIFRTTDGGDTWNKQESGVDALLNAIAFADSLTGIIVGSGGVILHTTNAGYSWVRQYLPLPLEVRAIPEPFATKTTLFYSIPKAASVDLKLYDMLGKEVYHITSDGIQSEGEHSLELHVENLPGGVYYFILTAGGFNGMGKVTKIVP
jgi:photosystem II stability/assembly factor-like uncharacterized protein